jgi:hypothetical protein
MHESGFSLVGYPSGYPQCERSEWTACDVVSRPARDALAVQLISVPHSSTPPCLGSRADVVMWSPTRLPRRLAAISRAPACPHPGAAARAAAGTTGLLARRTAGSVHPRPRPPRCQCRGCQKRGQARQQPRVRLDEIHLPPCRQVREPNDQITLHQDADFVPSPRRHHAALHSQLHVVAVVGSDPEFTPLARRVLFASAHQRIGTLV